MVKSRWIHGGYSKRGYLACLQTKLPTASPVTNIADQFSPAAFKGFFAEPSCDINDPENAIIKAVILQQYRLQDGPKSKMSLQTTAEKLARTVHTWHGVVVRSRHEQLRPEKLGRRQSITKSKQQVCTGFSVEPIANKVLWQEWRNKLWNWDGKSAPRQYSGWRK